MMLMLTGLMLLGQECQISRKQIHDEIRMRASTG